MSYACPKCQSTELSLLKQRTSIGYKRFRCKICRCTFNERRAKLGKSWYVDETYIKVKGKWCYLYRVIDRDGNLIDCRMSKQRDMDAAKAVFQNALEVSNEAPDRVTTDKEASYPRAIREELGEEVLHRTNKYLNNLIEQDHRGIKQR